MVEQSRFIPKKLFHKIIDKLCFYKIIISNNMERMNQYVRTDTKS